MKKKVVISEASIVVFFFLVFYFFSISLCYTEIPFNHFCTDHRLFFPLQR